MNNRDLQVCQTEPATETEDLDRSIIQVGFERCESNHSRYFYASHASFGAGKGVFPTTWRNIEGRQRTATRTYLANPITVIAWSTGG